MGLEFRDVAFSYAPGENIFSGINLKSIDKDVLVILGPNGCGKTTLLKCAAGILKAQQGEILLDGEDISSCKRMDIAKKIGYVSQEHSQGFAYSVKEFVVMGRTPYLNIFSSPAEKDYNIASESISSVGISHLKDKRYTELSGGEKQLVLIARMLTQQPSVLLLDEPTSHLDLKNQTVVLRLVKKLAKSGLSVIMTSHFPNHAITFAGHTAIMHRGAFIAQGPSEEIINEANLKRAYGIDIRVYTLIDPVDGTKLRFCAPARESEEIKAEMDSWLMDSALGG
jgi:iron complex transport system ATP-binding protein